MSIKWYWLAIAFVAGGLTVGAVMLGVTNGASARLQSELDATRASLADATASNGRLAGNLEKLRGDLVKASGRVTSLERTVSQQRDIIAEQQRDIDAGRRGLADLATGLSGGLGDLRSRAEAIRECVARLYAIYHPGGGGG